MKQSAENCSRNVNFTILGLPLPRHPSVGLHNTGESLLNKRIPSEASARTLLLAICLCLFPTWIAGQIAGAVCNEGAGQFSTRLASGVIVAVGPQKARGFATRACEASLVRGRKEVEVASNAAQVDIDVLGANLGLGAPVVAFQIEHSESDVGTTYAIYSLGGQPRLVRTLTKGDSYRAADTDMDGRVVIWTRDAVAVNRFEDIPLSEFEFPPSLALQFENQHLVDVSAQFQPYYDEQIAKLRAQLDPQLLGKFKKCDGQLFVVPPEELNDLLDLRSTKTKVLEIVWAYLYSGREQDAWRTLTELWPASDFDRIRKAIEGARAGGIRSEIDAEVSPAPPPSHKWRTQIYDLATQYISRDPMGKPMGFKEEQNVKVISSPLGNVTMPVQIFMDTPPPPDSEHLFPSSGVQLELILDSAGKVSSAKTINRADNGPISDALVKASNTWKFIPAMKNGQPVACRFHTTVSPYR